MGGGLMIFSILGMILMLQVLHGAQAVNYIVGGENVQWALPQSTGNNASFYSTWVASKQFQVGDNLIFKYQAGAHDVLQVRYPSDFKACNTQNPISISNSGYTVIPLTMTGSSYFICGIPGHCVQGMNLEVLVTSETAAAPAPSPSSPTVANSPLPSQGGPSPPTLVTGEAPTPRQGNAAILQPTLFVGAALLGWVVAVL